MATINDNDIINKFRDMVAKRYDYAELKERFQPFPEEITEKMIVKIKVYFLESIYPEAEQRKELENAFAGLGAYVKSPKKMWGLLGNMSSAIFKFGTQFPAAMKAGFSGLSAFHGAKQFESEMARIAMELNLEAPLSDEDFERVMSNLPKEDIESFINDVKSLFKTMTNTKLIFKTIQILENVVGTMRKKPDLYPSAEVDGIMLGRGILQNGFDLFSAYDDATKEKMVEYIYKNEIWYANTVYEKYNMK